MHVTTPNASAQHLPRFSRPLDGIVGASMRLAMHAAKFLNNLNAALLRVVPCFEVLLHDATNSIRRDLRNARDFAPYLASGLA